MVSISVVKAANFRLPATLPAGLTAVFIGATSGIGQSALRQYAEATREKKPTIHIVGRSQNAAVSLLAELRQANPSATIHFLQRDVSLLKEVDAAVEEIKKTADKVDLLFLSSGFIAFEGRKDTVEGLEPSMTTRYYSRARAIQLLLPLLQHSADPRVVNILAGGQEGPLLEDDLDLVKPGNYTFIKASVHSGTMLTLALERFAAENPEVSFVHAFPGLTATTTLKRGSRGIAKFLLQWVVSPVLNALFASRVDDVGARALYYSTSANYSSSASSEDEDGFKSRAERRNKGGVFLVGASGEDVHNEQVLGDLRERKVDEKVWEHTNNIWGRVLA